MDPKLMEPPFSPIKKAEVRFASRLAGIAFFEVWVHFENGGMKTINVHLSELKRMGVTKTLSGIHKTQAFLDSEVGQKYIEERLAEDRKGRSV